MFNKIYKSKYYPLVFQLITLIVFVLLIVGSIGVTASDASFAKQLRNTNLSNLIVWSYWWPLIVLTAVFFGRHWCSICPIELISAITTRFGLKVKPSKFIKSEWIIPILYAFVAVVAIHTWGIHRVPRLMAFYLLSLIILAIITSFIFEKRAFCSYFCPVGKLLGLYSLLSPFGLRVKNQNVCQTCKTKDCISKKNADKLIGRSCQSNLYPAKIDDNRNCILCTQCVKSCPHDNIGIHAIKNSFLSFDLDKLSLVEVGMINILIGFVCSEILSSWKMSDRLLSAFPNWLFNLFSFESLSPVLFEAIVVFLVVPLVFMLVISGIAKAMEGKTLSFYIKRLAGYLLPVLAFGHVFKALLKTTSRIPYWQYATDKPEGLYYADKILNNEIVINTIAWLDVAVIILGIAGLLFSVVYSIRKIKRDNGLLKANKWFYGLIVSLYCAILLYGPISIML